jgi:hypothetical protein
VSSPIATATQAQTPTTTVTLDAYGTPIMFPTTAMQNIVYLVPNICERLEALTWMGA